MLQLVQAYRYENFNLSCLKQFFFSRVFQNLEIANTFHWLVHLEQYDHEGAQLDEDDIFIKEKYQVLYDEFMDICKNDYPDYYKSLSL